MDIVLDTNCLIQIVSRRSRYYELWQDFISGSYRLCVTNDICAIVANAHYIVTEDTHFNVLKHLSFPHVSVLKLNEFDEIMSKNR